MREREGLTPRTISTVFSATLLALSRKTLQREKKTDTTHHVNYRFLGDVLPLDDYLNALSSSISLTPRTMSTTDRFLSDLLHLDDYLNALSPSIALTRSRRFPTNQCRLCWTTSVTPPVATPTPVAAGACLRISRRGATH